MTGLENLGPDDFGNPNSASLRSELDSGKLMPEVRRRLWTQAGGQGVGRHSTASSVLTGGGIFSSIGTGVANATLSLGNIVGVDTNLYELLPKDLARNLAHRNATANVFGIDEVFGKKVGDIGKGTGEIASLFLGGGAAKGASWLGKGISGTANVASAPGRLLRGLSWPGAKIGQRVAKLPAFQKWSKTAGYLEPVIGSATGFGLYEFMTQAGDFEERKGHFLHGLAAGAFLGVVGKAAGDAEKWMLNTALKPEQIEMLGTLRKTIMSGRTPSWGQLKATAALGGANGITGAIENTGFAMLSDDFWQALGDGDVEKAMGEYVTTLPAALLARTGNHQLWRDFKREAPHLNSMELRQEVMRTREQPQEPSPEMQGPPLPPEMQAAGQRLLESGWDIPDFGPAAPGEIPLQFPGGGHVTFTNNGQIAVTRDVFREVMGDAEVARSKELDHAYQWAQHVAGKSFGKEQAGSMEGMAKQEIEMDVDIDVARSLLKHAPKGSVLANQLQGISDSGAPYGPVRISGIEAARTIMSYRDVAGTDPNSKRVNDWLNASAEEVLRWAMVEKHGEGSLGGQLAKEAPRMSLKDFADKQSGDVYMEGEVAQQFAENLSALSQMRQMSGEIRFGDHGEIAAGGPWKGSDKKMYAVGLDGRTYTRSWPPRRGEEWVPTKTSEEAELSMETSNPALQRWVDLAEAIQLELPPSPGSALIESAVAAAINGPPGSRSLSELRRVLETLPADEISMLLTPETINQIGHLLGRVGSGHATADHVIGEVDVMMQRGPQKKPAEKAKPEEVPEHLRDADFEGEIDRMDREGGFISGEMLKDAGDAIAEGAKKVGEMGTRSSDYMFETQAEVLRKAMPQDTMSQRGRRSLSLGRTIRGTASERWKRAEESAKHAEGKMWLNEWMIHENGNWRPAREGEAGEVKRWELVTDGHLKLPDNAPQWQKDYVKGHRSVNEYFFETARDYGTVRSKIGNPDSSVPLKDGGKYVTQRIGGKDADQVYGDAAKRHRWFKYLVDRALNQGVRITTPSGQNRRVRVEDLEAQYQAERDRITDPESADSSAAFEHYRLLPDVPMQWKDPVSKQTYEMRENDVTQVMGRVIKEQSRRTANIQVFGQDLSQAQRQAAMDYVSDPANAVPPRQAAAVIRNASELTGPTATVRDWGRRLDSTDGPKIGAHYKTKLKQRARTWMRTLQGSFEQPTEVSKAIRATDIIPRAFGTITAFTHDIFEGMATLPLHYGGIRRFLATHADFWSNPNEALRLAQRQGAVNRKLGDLIYGEGPQLLQRIADMAGKPGEVVELYKGALFSSLADVTLRDWANGRTIKADARMLNELRFTPEEATSLMSGKAPKALQTQFRNEFVQQLSGRRDKGEGSAFADNPDMQSIFRYGNWASSRTGQILRSWRDVMAAETPQARMRALGRSASLLANFEVAGAGGMLIGMMVSAALSGDWDEGAPRWWREASDAPGMFALKALGMQTVVGPTGRWASVSSDSSDARALASVSVPTQLVFSMAKLLEGANRGDTSALYEAAKAHGYVPLRNVWSKGLPRLFGMWLPAAIAGHEISMQDDAISDSALTWEFRNRPGAERGAIGLPVDRQPTFPRNNEPEFYDHMKEAMKVFYESVAGVELGNEKAMSEAAEKGWKAAFDHLEKARHVDDVKKGSLSSWIRSQKHFSGWQPRERMEFLQYAGRDRMVRMLNHDRMIDALEKHSNELRHIPISDPDWHGQVDRFRDLIGVGDVDTGTVDDVIAHAKLLLKKDWGATSHRVQDIAHVLASSDEGIKKVFQGDTGEDLVLEESHALRALYIEQELLDRAQNILDREAEKDR